MANSIIPQDVYQIINDISDLALGKSVAHAVDTSSFVAVGETLLRTGTENLFNAISTVLSRTIFSVRPYRRKLSSMEVSADRWGAQSRKISFLWTDCEPSQDWNTNIAPDRLDDGNSIDMYKIRKPKPVQTNFYGTKVLQKHITRFRDQLALAFSSEDEFMRFVNAYMVEFRNEIEVANESKSRATYLNLIGGLYEMKTGNPSSVIDLAELFNGTFGTAYSRAQLLSVALEDFMKFTASTIKTVSEAMTDIGYKYHTNLANADIPRHTPKSRQKMLMYNPLFIQAKSQVYSSLFNPEYLDIGTFEGVNFWQYPKNPHRILVKPNILNTTTGASTEGTEQTIEYVLGLLYDEEAMGIMPQYDYSSATPFNSAGGYWNIFMHWRFNAYNDFTENAVLFIIGPGGAGQKDVQDVNLMQIKGADPSNTFLKTNVAAWGGGTVSSPTKGALHVMNCYLDGGTNLLPVGMTNPLPVQTPLSTAEENHGQVMPGDDHGNTSQDNGGSQEDPAGPDNPATPAKAARKK